MIWRKPSNTFFNLTLSSLITLAAGSALTSSLVLSVAPAWATTLAEADELLLKGQLSKAEDAYRELLVDDESGDAYAGLAVALASNQYQLRFWKQKSSCARPKKNMPPIPISWQLPDMYPSFTPKQ